MNVEIELPEKAAFLLERKARYKVGHGGRAGLKSHSFAKALVVRAASEKIRILCTREIQNSISDSVMQLLKDKIEECGLSSKFSVGKSHIRCLATGSYFLFYGLKTNISKIKSLEAIDIVWIEEAAAISKNSWRTLTPTIRRDDAEIWVTFNPEHEDDPTSVMFLGPNPVPDSIVVKFGWEDADALGWFSEGMRQEKDWMYQTDPEEAIHVWGGDFKKKSNASIFGAKTLTDKDHNGNVVNTISVPAKYKVESFEVPYKIKTDPRTKKEVSRTCLWDGPYFGADFGFSNDPSTLMKLWVKPEPRCLMIEHEAWGLGIEGDAYGPFYDKVPGSREHIIRGDSSRPETIYHIRNLGFNIVGVEKWPNSIEEGIRYLKSFQAIIIHPRCIHQIQEAKNYKHKVDQRTGDVLAEIVDKWNHCWDATRYAMQPAIAVAEETIEVSEDYQIEPISSSLDELD